MATVAGCGWQRRAEQLEKGGEGENASSSAVLSSLAMALAGRDREEREKENGEGVSGEEGAGPGLKHGKVAARARQVAASAAKPSHAARTASTVTVMALFRKFKYSILPQTYH